MLLSTKPIIPWMGGKTRLLDQLVPLLPPHDCYVEVFAGGAALLLAKPPSKCEVLNDINGELINLYRIVQHHLNEFIEQYRWSLTSRALFEWMKQADPESLTDIQRAARFYYLQHNAFGGKCSGQNFGTATTGRVGINHLRIKEDLSAAHLRLAHVVIERLTWHACVDRYDRPHTLFFCDPPYWGTEGYGVDFPLHEYERMATLAKSINGRMIITVNDHPEMRRVFDGLPMETVGITYTVGGGGKSGRVGELIIRNREDGFGGQVALL